MKTLAIIPARGGSKGVPRKNIRLLDGKPLIAYSIEAALQSQSVTRCIVNTDDEEIAAIAKKYPVEVLIRPANQAQDHSPILPVVLSTLAFAETSTGSSYDAVILLQPTSPLRTAIDIDQSLALLQSPSAPDGVISVVQLSDAHPARMYRVDDDQFMHTIWPDGETVHRQQLLPVYLRNGCIYAVKKSALLEENTLMVKNKKAYIMDEQWLANIDTERDFAITEYLIKQWKSK